MVAPEFGGDGRKRAEAGKYPDPIIAFPAHWAPVDLMFYTGTQFPARYRNGAFIAFHGSWNRSPQAGHSTIVSPARDVDPRRCRAREPDVLPAPRPIPRQRRALVGAAGQVPAVVVGRAASHPQHRVHRRAAAEHLAARFVNAPTAGTRLGFGDVVPVDLRVEALVRSPDVDHVRTQKRTP